jgi:hypothetical protein
MSAGSPEHTLTVDHPPSDAEATATRRRSWFTSLIWLLLIVQFSWVIAGVALAMAGVFSLSTLLPTWLVLGMALWIASRPARRATTPSTTTRRATTPSTPSPSTPSPSTTTPWIRGGAVTIALATVVLNGAFPGEHMQTGRDGGTYTATAGWIASDGGLLINTYVPPFDDPTELGYDAAGFHQMEPNGPLYAQFMHAFPAIMATVDLAAGLPWMVRINALLGGLALLAFYAFGERVTRPWAALLAQVALAANLVFIYFTRAPFSELLTMSMLFFGLWALDQAVEQRDRTTGFLAGLLMGGAFVARLDGLVAVLMVVVALLPPMVGGRLRRVAPAALLGIGVSGAFALIDLFVFSPYYVELHVQFLVPLAAGFVAAGLLALVVRTAPGRAVVRTIMRNRRQVAIALALVIVAAGVLVYFVRPGFDVASWDRTTPIGGLQQVEGQDVDEARTYAEQSALWLGWYLGGPGLAIAVLGWAGLIHHAVARRITRLAPFLLAVSGLITLYIWMPSITPDHIWADRRFLPVIIPGLVLCGAWVLDRAWQLAAPRPWRVPAQSLLALATLLFLAGPLRMSVPLASLHEQAGMAGDVADACERLGDDAAILLLDEPAGVMHHRMTQPLRAHCGIPAAWASSDISDERLLELAERAGDRTLYVLAEHPESFENRPVGEVFTLLDHHGVRLEATLTMPPRDLVGYGLSVLAAPVQPASSTGTG